MAKVQHTTIVLVVLTVTLASVVTAVKPLSPIEAGLEGSSLKVDTDALAGPSNQLFLGKVDPNPCNIGPTWWCSANNALDMCLVAGKEVFPCGYNSKFSCNSTRITVDDFCVDETLNATTFNGGVTGSPTGQFGYYALALYWAPSSCKPGTQELGGFCSEYTQPGNEAYDHLVVHGLWPDYGSLYETEPQPPQYVGQYQGWPQFCDGPEGQFGECAVTGGLCSWPNATGVNFTQSDYEDCMRIEGVEKCLVPDETLALLQPQFETHAPGYLGPLNTFMDHEWTKHGTCIGGYLSTNITAYFDVTMQWATYIINDVSNIKVSALIEENKNGSVPVDTFLSVVDGTAAVRCNAECELEELWFCLGRDAAGFPTDLITCPAGTLASSNCMQKNCTDVKIPHYTAAEEVSSTSSTTG